MKKTIITIVIILLAGGIYFALNKQISIAQVELINLKPKDIVFLRENTKYATSTDDLGNVIKTGIKIPIKYDFPVATTTGYVIEEIEGVMEMNFGAYNQCRQKKTKEVCLSELRDDIESNVETFKENIKRKLEELKQLEFQEEILLKDL